MMRKYDDRGNIYDGTMWSGLGTVLTTLLYMDMRCWDNRR